MEIEVGHKVKGTCIFYNEEFAFFRCDAVKEDVWVHKNSVVNIDKLKVGCTALFTIGINRRGYIGTYVQVLE